MMEYKRSNNQVPPISWEDYLQSANKKWKKLLSSKNIHEREIQIFLEQHPSLIPGAYGILSPSGHMPVYGAVFSQPILPGIKTKNPDFMWIAINSAEINPILIEIKTFDKKWFTKEGQPTADFTQAENQLNKLRIWFSEPTNIIDFQKLYIHRLGFNKEYPIKPYYVLIYGRRKDVEDEKYMKLRSAKRKSDEMHMTFDRLSFLNDQSNLVTVKMKTDEIHIISFPPNCRIGPEEIMYWKHFKNLPQFYSKAPGITEERRKFLVERFNYGKQWIDSNEQIYYSIVGE